MPNNTDILLSALDRDPNSIAIIDGEKSVVWQQASNRVHAQKSIINWCLN